MVKAFCRECYIGFLKESVDFIMDPNNNLEKLKKTFLSYIDENEENYNYYIKALDSVRDDLNKDLDFFMDSDPAIDSKNEVIWAYPGYKAITCYRIAHILWIEKLHIPARIISEVAHSLTGIDIHPASYIEAPFFIDHGTGIVIGETSVIHANVKIYQGVTLGALSLNDVHALKGVKRHPTICKGVTIYACATILGDITIGENCTIGANVFLTESVDANMKVTIAKPTLVIKEKK